MEWQPIETAPKDGTIVDLWISSTGDNSDADDVKFWCSGDDFYDKKTHRRMGRVTSLRWEKRGMNNPGWYPTGGLTGYPLGVTPTHWMPRPDPPKEL